MYVELKNTVEGLIRTAEMRDDYYIYDEENHMLIGRLSGRTYCLGDTVSVRVAAADMRARNRRFCTGLKAKAPDCCYKSEGAEADNRMCSPGYGTDKMKEYR